MSELSEIRSIFDSDISQSVERFQKKISSLVDPLVSQINSVPYDPSTSTDTFDRVTVAFSVGIGDSSKGIYGDFVVDLSKSIEKCSQSISRYTSNLMITTESQLNSVQSEIASISTHITDTSSAAQKKISELIASYSNKFSSALEVAQVKASEYFITALTDSHVGAIERADKIVSDSINTLIQTYNSYNKTLPPGFYTDVNTILTEISTKYNNDLSKANLVYNDSISSYKYFSKYAQSQITSSQKKISGSLSASNAKVTALFSSIPSTLYNKADYAFAIAISVFSSKLFNESIRIRNQLDNLVFDLSERSNGTLNIIDRYFVTHYIPIYVDGSEYRNGKAEVLNGISKIVSDAINAISTEYNSKTSVISDNYNTFLSSIQNDVISYINDNVPGLTEEQLTTIQNRLSSTISNYNTRISNYFSSYSASLSNVTNGLSTYLNSKIDKYYKNQPLLRYTGSNTAPSRISKQLSYLDVDGKIVYNNKFEFGVSNIGSVAWQGWFGIRLRSSVDASAYAEAYLEETGETFTGSYETPEFKWNKRVGLESLLPGETKSFSVIVPGNLIYNLEELGSYVISSVVINTYRGIYK